nr:HNH endonuclease family protein [Kutzneria buriramensis]WKX05988.1 HNH endonuclease family protein [Kutzneria buriramensis]
MFNHWIDADRDGCSTRAEVLLEEATVAPEVTGRCTLRGGQWYSWYDDQYVDNARSLDIDHLVPLAEAWDSGASQWTSKRRENYANDLGDERALVAVTARSNRQKSDQDPREWLPDNAVVCRYVADWTAVKLRWTLTVDPAEQQTLTDLAAGCPNSPVTVTPRRLTGPWPSRPERPGVKRWASPATGDGPHGSPVRPVFASGVRSASGSLERGAGGKQHRGRRAVLGGMPRSPQIASGQTMPQFCAPLVLVNRGCASSAHLTGGLASGAGQGLRQGSDTRMAAGG